MSFPEKSTGNSQSRPGEGTPTATMSPVNGGSGKTGTARHHRPPGEGNRNPPPDRRRTLPPHFRSEKREARTRPGFSFSSGRTWEKGPKPPASRKKTSRRLKQPPTTSPGARRQERHASRNTCPSPRKPSTHPKSSPNRKLGDASARKSASSSTTGAATSGASASSEENTCARTIRPPCRGSPRSLPTFRTAAPPRPASSPKVVTNRYLLHLPYHRQADTFTRQGVPLHRKTLCDRARPGSDWLAAIHREICHDHRQITYRQIDETPINYPEPGNRRTKTGYLWTSSVPGGSVIYHWQAGRAQSGDHRNLRPTPSRRGRENRRLRHPVRRLQRLPLLGERQAMAHPHGLPRPRPEEIF